MGQIPPVVRHSIEYAGYVNAALGEINEAEIKAIEEDMQRIPKSQSDSNAKLRNCFEKFENEPKDFRFLSGDKAIIRMLAATIQKRGFNHYMKRQKIFKKSHQTQHRTTENVVDCESAIRRRVLEFYQKR